jgi:hypothetical protein
MVADIWIHIYVCTDEGCGCLIYDLPCPFSRVTRETSAYKQQDDQFYLKDLVLG